MKETKRAEMVSNIIATGGIDMLLTGLDSIDWGKVSKIPNLEERFIGVFRDYVNWSYILKHQEISRQLLSYLGDKGWHWERETHLSKLSEENKEFANIIPTAISNIIAAEGLDILLVGLESINWHKVSMMPDLPEDFIREFKDYVHWGTISRCQKLSEELIEEFQNEVSWVDISTFQNLSEDFIEKFKDKVYWTCISRCQKLSECIIAKYADKVEWNYISMYQKLSEAFIEKFEDRVNWTLISNYQKLSRDFIIKHKNKLDLYGDSCFPNLLPDDRLKLTKLISKYALKGDPLTIIE